MHEIIDEFVSGKYTFIETMHRLQDALVKIIYDEAKKKRRLLRHMNRGDDMDDADICYECEGYGDDYYIDADGELVCACDTCYVTKRIEDSYMEKSYEED